MQTNCLRERQTNAVLQEWEIDWVLAAIRAQPGVDSLQESFDGGRGPEQAQVPQPQLLPTAVKQISEEEQSVPCRVSSISSLAANKASGHNVVNLCLQRIGILKEKAEGKGRSTD